mgnify:CR=1 FL=1
MKGKFSIVVKLTLLLGMLALLVGCARSVQPVNGSLMSDVKASYSVSNPDIDNMKTGKSKCQSILGLVATGDCSISAAAEEAGIEKVRRVDYKSENILGIIAKHIVIVHGE